MQWDILSPIWGSQSITVLRTKFESPQSWLNYRSGFGTVVDRYRWEGGCIAEHVRPFHVYLPPQLIFYPIPSPPFPPQTTGKKLLRKLARLMANPSFSGTKARSSPRIKGHPRRRRVRGLQASRIGTSRESPYNLGWASDTYIRLLMCTYVEYLYQSDPTALRHGYKL